MVAVAGQIIEASAARLPFICGYFVDNQKENYLGIKKNNLAICVDDFMIIEENKLYSAIKEITIKAVANNINLRQVDLFDKKYTNILYKQYISRRDNIYKKQGFIVNEVKIMLWILGFLSMILVFGFWVTIAVFVPLFLILFGRENWKLTSIFTVILWLSIYLIFSVAMKVSFYGGAVGLAW